MKTKTNRQLGKELGVHSRQISKSRRRGWLWKDGKKVKYVTPTTDKALAFISNDR
jgi:hypothetical protein